MKDRVKIKVTQDHIKGGMPRTDNFCPIALAIKEHCKTDSIVVKSTRVYVDCLRYDSIKQVRVWKKKFELPKHASHFITDFDNNLPVKPFEFTMKEIPGESHIEKP